MEGLLSTWPLFFYQLGLPRLVISLTLLTPYLSVLVMVVQFHDQEAGQGAEEVADYDHPHHVGHALLLPRSPPLLQGVHQGRLAGGHIQACTQTVESLGLK